MPVANGPHSEPYRICPVACAPGSDLVGPQGHASPNRWIFAYAGMTDGIPMRAATTLSFLFFDHATGHTGYRILGGLVADFDVPLLATEV